jgi:catechol 2,3-dioxygenase-like lactoylglutathione lyase family enzyme
VVETSQKSDPSEYSSNWISGIGYHVAIEVPDMEHALHFYRDLFGMPVAWRHFVGGTMLASLSGIEGAEAEVVQLSCPGGSRIELISYRPVGQPDPRKLNDQGLNHLSLGVDNVQATYDRLLKDGVDFSCEPIQISDPSHPLYGWFVTYLKDPWGTVLELLGPDPANPTDTGERSDTRLEETRGA